MELRWAHEGGGVPGGIGRAPYLVPTSKLPSRRVQVSWVIFGKKIMFQKGLFYLDSVWTPFDIPFLRNTEIGKKQQFWAGPPVNRLVPKII